MGECVDAQCSLESYSRLGVSGQTGCIHPAAKLALLWLDRIRSLYVN